MRIAITLAHFRSGVGGGENIALDVVRALRVRGHQVLVLALTGDHEADFQRVSISRTREAAEKWGADLLVDWGIRVSADVHYLHGGPHEIFLQYATYTVPIWLRFWKRIEFFLKLKHRRVLKEQKVLFSDLNAGYLAVSEFVASQVRAMTVSDSLRIRVLHNPVDTKRFNPEGCLQLRSEARASLGIPEDAVTFVWVAHNPRLKNLRLLLKIFPAIHRSLASVRLLVVGKRPPRKSAPWLVCAGDLQRPEIAYAASDALLHPTYYDTFANVVVEAMSCGLPVVCSDRAGAAEVLRKEGGGEVLPVVGENVERLWTEVVRRWATDPWKLAIHSKAARAAALKHDFQDYIQRLEEEFRMFIRSKNSTS
jgi:UDP-glucose:(heptosyl)LPS alpha-1,3-glucosyltransferase